LVGVSPDKAHKYLTRLLPRSAPAAGVLVAAEGGPAPFDPHAKGQAPWTPGASCDVVRLRWPVAVGVGVRPDKVHCQHRGRRPRQEYPAGPPASQVREKSVKYVGAQVRTMAHFLGRHPSHASDLAGVMTKRQYGLWPNAPVIYTPARRQSPTPRAPMARCGEAGRRILAPTQAALPTTEVRRRAALLNVGHSPTPSRAERE
jgi:hypothetical protein